MRLNTSANVVITVCMLFLAQACSTGNKGPTLADIEYKPIEIKQTKPVVIKKAEVIKSYKKLLELSPKVNKKGKEVHRLADLELESSLDKQLSENAEIAELGKIESQSAIERYELYLKSYPGRADNDKVLYQLSRAYTLNNESDKSSQAMLKLVTLYPYSRYTDEIQFRLGEQMFVEGKFKQAETAYGVVVNRFPNSSYYEKSLYKYAWTLFKLNKIDAAVNHYIKLLDIKQGHGYLEEMAISEKVTRAERELLNDVLRVISLSFTYLPIEQPISTSLDRFGKRPYEALLYRKLGELYKSKDRISDATNTFLAFVRIHPDSQYTPDFHGWAIDGFKKGGLGFVSLILPEMERFIVSYNPGSSYWEKQSKENQLRIQPMLTGYMNNVATHYHTVARTTKKPRDYGITVREYRRYLEAFPGDKDAPKMNFLLADALYESSFFASAAEEYEKTAYAYDQHDKSIEAGYSALFTYKKVYEILKTDEEKKSANQKIISSLLKYSDRFPYDNRLPAILLSTAENYYTLKVYKEAVQATQLLVQDRSINSDIQHKAWVIMAHSNFELGDYKSAERAYKESVSNLHFKSDQRGVLVAQLGTSVYRQGEQARSKGNHREAAGHFERVGRLVPGSPLRIIADYDAATAYVAAKDWTVAIRALEKFRKQYPKEVKWKQGVTEKLALAYSSQGSELKAAKEMMSLVAMIPEDQKRDMLWQAAELYNKAGEDKKAIDIYKTYVKKYPSPLSRSIELRHKIALFYQPNKNKNEYRKWLKSIVDADAKANDKSDRSRYLAATALLELITPLRISYSEAKLTIPLKKSLKKKKQLMKESIESYKKAAKYQVAEVTTAATFNIAEIYSEFANALLKSERPKNLNKEELEEYNYLLEDQAFPFEEKALDIHQSNIKKIPEGIFDESIKLSLIALGKLMPFRYAKNEVVDEYVEANP